jgi:hypothetical protein
VCHSFGDGRKPSAIFTGYIIAFVLRRFGVTGVFSFIAAAMVVVVLVIGSWGRAPAILLWRRYRGE